MPRRLIGTTTAVLAMTLGACAGGDGVAMREVKDTAAGTTSRHTISGTVGVKSVDYLVNAPRALGLSTDDGTFDTALKESSAGQFSHPCVENLLPGGYDDIRTGTQVVITDGAGVVIATTKLEDGRSSFDARKGKIFGCIFHFSAPVPSSGFYTLKVSNRPGPTYSESDLVASGWNAELTLG